MKPYHILSIVLLCLIGVLSSCQRELNRVPGRPGDRYACEFVYKIHDCADGVHYCGRFKYNLYYFRMETALLMQPGDKVILDYGEMVNVIVESPECKCDPM